MDEVKILKKKKKKGNRIINQEIHDLFNNRLMPTLHHASRPRFNSNQAFLLVQKMKLASWAFTLGVKTEIEKSLFNLPQVY
jgi:hypothetical protein